MTKAVERMAGGIKLNYAVPKTLDDALADYCEQTGRTASDVIRQLLAEYIDGERKPHATRVTFSGGVRSNMILPKTLRVLLDEKIAMDAEDSRGSVIVRLLYDFLQHRVESNETITISVERSLYERLYEKAQANGTTVEDVVIDACRVTNKVTEK